MCRKVIIPREIENLIQFLARLLRITTKLHNHKTNVVISELVIYSYVKTTCHTKISPRRIIIQ